MAYIDANLALLAHGNNMKLWMYHTTDAPSAVDASGYFDAKAKELNIGDMIISVDVDDVGTPTAVSGVGMHVVVANSGTVVDVSNNLLGVFSDTD